MNPAHVWDLKPKVNEYNFLKEKIFKVEHAQMYHGIQALTSLLSKQRMKHIEIIEFARIKKPKPKQFWNLLKSEYDEMTEEMQEEKIMVQQVLSWICDNKSHFKSLREVHFTNPKWYEAVTIIAVDELKKNLKSKNIWYGNFELEYVQSSS